jgi:hypothetical protein
VFRKIYKKLRALEIMKRRMFWIILVVSVIIVSVGIGVFLKASLGELFG